MSMIDRLIDTFTSKMEIEQVFDEEAFTLTVRTSYGGKLIHEHISDMQPMFDAFKKRLKKK